MAAGEPAATWLLVKPSSWADETTAAGVSAAGVAAAGVSAEETCCGACR